MDMVDCMVEMANGHGLKEFGRFLKLFIKENMGGRKKYVE